MPVFLRVFAKNAQYDLKMHSYKDKRLVSQHVFGNSAQLCQALCAKKLGMIENFEYLGEFEKDF